MDRARTAAAPNPAFHHQQFRHQAFFYADADEFVGGMLAFIRGGQEHGEPVLVVVSAEKIGALRDALGNDEGVRFADMQEVGANPARIIPAWRDFVDEHASAGQPVRGIGEPVFPERNTDELMECQRHEELLNVAFDGGVPWWLLCPYDTTALPAPVIDGARRSHPHLSGPGWEGVSPDAAGLAAMAAPVGTPLSDPPVPAQALRFDDAGALHTLRAAVHARAVAHGLDDARAAALELAVHEIAANSLVHGGGAGTLRVWATDRAVVCDVESGGSVQEPLAGRRRPASDAPRGRGLWLAHQLCDLVQIRSNGEGTVVRVHMWRDALHA